MKRAYGVLSDAEQRTECDSTLEMNREAGPRPIFALKDFVTGVEAESNRRLGVLSLLYNQRQTDPEHPGVSLLDLEREMGFPREYLSFTPAPKTMWQSGTIRIMLCRLRRKESCAQRDRGQTPEPGRVVFPALRKGGQRRQKSTEQPKRDSSCRPIQLIRTLAERF